MTTTTLTPSTGGTTHETRMDTKGLYWAEFLIDLGTGGNFQTAKGSALAASEVIECIKLPANTVVLAAYAQKETAMTGTSTDATITLQVGANAYSSALDYDAAAVAAWTVPVAPTATLMTVVTTADTLDVVFNAFTGTITGGKIRVKALISDMTKTNLPGGIAALGS